MQPVSRVVASLVLGLAAVTSVSACSHDDSASGSSSGQPATTKASEDGPDTSDPRKFADWAATRFLKKDTLALCKYATADMKADYGKVGWCEHPPSWSETPVQVTLLGSCATANNAKFKGTIYLYKVKPSITFGWPSVKNGNAVSVGVTDAAPAQLGAVQPSYTLEDNEKYEPGCAGGHVDGATATLDLGA